MINEFVTNLLNLNNESNEYTDALYGWIEGLTKTDVFCNMVKSNLTLQDGVFYRGELLHKDVINSGFIPNDNQMSFTVHKTLATNFLRDKIDEASKDRDYNDYLPVIIVTNKLCSFPLSDVLVEALLPSIFSGEDEYVSNGGFHIHSCEEVTLDDGLSYIQVNVTQEINLDEQYHKLNKLYSKILHDEGVKVNGGDYDISTIHETYCEECGNATTLIVYLPNIEYTICRNRDCAHLNKLSKIQSF